MKKLEIEIPNDKEIDWEASAKQEKIVLKNKQLKYEDVCDKLFEKGHYYTNASGELQFYKGGGEYCPNNASTSHQLNCILSKNMLANVAVCLNNGWQPDLDREYGYCIILDLYNNFTIDHCAVLCTNSLGQVMFKSRELAQQAIKILGEETIRLALEPLY